jgi:exodeoxyribonuclease-5
VVEFNRQQERALHEIREWHGKAEDGEDSQVFRLFGFAGTGKTTIAKEVCSFAGKVQFAALTGKAALVLRSKGCEGARTIHSMIYRSQDKSRNDRDALKHHLETMLSRDPPPTDEEVRALEREIEQKNKDLMQPTFLRNEFSFSRAWDDDEQQFVTLVPPNLIVVDECSMVDRRVGQDLEQFGIPILVLGDPAQLPPVAGGGYWTGTKENPIEPDALLTEIHRQAADNPVLQIATACRTSGMPGLGTYGTSRIVGRSGLTPEEWLAADQILTGRNDTRQAINRRIRALKGFDGFLPQQGERLVCLRNNHDKGLLNGSMWEVVGCEDMPEDRFFTIELKSMDDSERENVFTLGHKKPFLGQAFEDHYERRDADEFDFGYAITTHKAQGSEWPNVIYVDEWPRGDKKQHQYTGVTRASESITVVKWAVP